MRLLSWTRLCILLFALCVTCQAGVPGNLESHPGPKLLERQKDKNDKDEDEEEEDKEDKRKSSTRAESRQSATSTVPRRESSKTSAAPKTTSTIIQSTRTTSPPSSLPSTTARASVTSESTSRSSSSSESLAFLTATSITSSISTSSSSTSSADIAQSTPPLALQPSVIEQSEHWWSRRGSSVRGCCRHRDRMDCDGQMAREQETSEIFQRRRIQTRFRWRSSKRALLVESGQSHGWREGVQGFKYAEVEGTVATFEGAQLRLFF